MIWYIYLFDIQRGGLLEKSLKYGNYAAFETDYFLKRYTVYDARNVKD